MDHSNISIWWKKLICRTVGYYAEKAYSFTLDNNQQLRLIETTEPESSKLIQIIGRCHYSETVQAFPVDNKKELAALIKLNVANEQSGRCFHLVRESEQGHSKVNFWHCTETLPKAVFHLPETLLMSQYLSEGQVLNNQVFSHYFLTEKHQVTHSALAGQLINNSERFANTIGLNYSSTLIIDDISVFAHKLALGLWHLPKTTLTAFINSNSIKLSPTKLKPLLLLSFGLSATYLALGSAYLTVEQYRLNSYLTEHNEQINRSLNALNDYQQQTDALTQLVAFNQQHTILSPVFLVLADLSVMTRFDNIRYEKDRFVLRGSAAKATEVLERLLNNIRVRDAKFDFPTRTQRERDEFVISFVLNSNIDQQTINGADNKSEVE